jgi:hypothetical protein
MFGEGEGVVPLGLAPARPVPLVPIDEGDIFE